MSFLDPKPLTLAAGNATYAPASGSANYAPARVDSRLTGGADVVLLIGQSNMQGGGLGWDATLDVTYPSTIFQLAGSGPSAGTVIPAKDTLYHVSQWGAVESSLSRVGPGMEFARQHLKTLPANRTILLVPAAEGSTSITGSATYSWDPTNIVATTNLYHRAVAQARAALALHPANRLVAILWGQGEGDTGIMTESAYRTKLLQIIDGLRAEFGKGVPFLVGGMVPEWTEVNAGRLAIDAAHRSIPANRPYTAFVPGPQGMTQDSGGIHYNAAGAREMGLRYHQGFRSIYANTVVKEPVRDSMATAGTLMILDPNNPAGQWAAGLPATVPNLAQSMADSILGVTAETPALYTSAVAGKGLVERSSKGGIHVAARTTATASNDASMNITYPAAIASYISANYAHTFFVSSWLTTTAVAASPANDELYVSNIQSGTNFGLALRNRQAPRFSTQNRVATYAATLGAHRLNGAVTMPATFGTSHTAVSAMQAGNAMAASGGDLGKVGSYVLYRFYLEDMTISRRTYAQLEALDAAAYAKAFGTDGRYAGDTWTNPATV